MRVLITGSTTWTDNAALRREMSALPARTTLVTGDTPHADRKAYPEDSWKGLNERMLATGIDLVLAFHADYGKPGCARGTVHMVELAKAAGIEARTFLS